MVANLVVSPYVVYLFDIYLLKSPEKVYTERYPQSRGSLDFATFLKSQGWVSDKKKKKKTTGLWSV